MVKNVCLFFIVLFVGNSCTNFSRIQKSDNMDLKYKAAMNYYNNKEYSKSGTLFEEMIPLLKGQTEAEKAQFYYAYSQFKQGQLVLSAYYFKRFYETFPRSELAEEAYYMQCRSLFEDSPDYELDQTNTQSALESIQQFLERYPSGPHLQDCNDMVDKLLYKLELKSYSHAKLYYRTHTYKSSVVAFENFIKDFPNSKYIEECTFLKVEAQYDYSMISIETKRKDRLQIAIELYLVFIDKFPNSTYLPRAEVIYEKIQAEIVRLDLHHHKTEHKGALNTN